MKNTAEKERTAAGTAKPRRLKRGLSTKATDNLTGLLFISPSLIGFLVFTVFGVIFSLYMAFTDFNIQKGIAAAKWVGLQNFASFKGDEYFIASMRNNLILILAVPVTIFLAAVIASAMNKAVFWPKGARAAYFLPYVTNTVAVATVMQAMFHSTKGPINMVLKALGVSADKLPGWFASSKWALPAVFLVLIWSSLGYDILMYSSALQSIPTEYYEAAKIDGANSWQRFFKITIPMLSPTTFLLTILGIIGSMQQWTLEKLLTKGGPGTATFTSGLYIYRNGFVNFRDGYASAISWLVFVIILIITLIQFRGQKNFSVS